MESRGPFRKRSITIKRKRDIWDKAEVIAKVIGAVAIGTLGIFSSFYLANQQNAEMKTRLYTELLGKREEAESGLRKDMFKEIMGPFLRPDSTTLDAQVLELELLSLNFHESLDLVPLFWHLIRKIDKIEEDVLNHSVTEEGKSRLKDAKKFRKRLERVAKEIVSKQSSLLKYEGAYVDLLFKYDSIPEDGFWLMKDKELVLDNITRIFSIRVDSVDITKKEIDIALGVFTPNKGSGLTRPDLEFGVGFYDFPMINNTRLSGNQRCAVVLERFEEDDEGFYVIILSLICFPSEYAGMKEKAFLNDLLKEVLGDDSD